MKNALDLYCMSAAALVWTLRVVLSAEEFFAAMARAAQVEPASDGQPLMAVLFGADNVESLSLEMEWYALKEDILMDGRLLGFYRSAFVSQMRNIVETTPALAREAWEGQVEKAKQEANRKRH